MIDLLYFGKLTKHETDGVGSIPTRCGRMDNQEVGQK